MTTIPTKPWRSLMRRILIACSTDFVRLNLCQVRLEPTDDNKVRAVATDGHRLHVLEVDAEALGFAPDCPIHLSRQGLGAALLATKDQTYAVVKIDHNGSLIVNTSPVSVTVHASSHVFPPYRQIMPKTPPEASIVLSAKEIRQAVRDVPGSDTCKALIGIRTSDDGHLVPPDAGHGAHVLVNRHYLLDAVKASGAAEITIEVRGNLDPVMVKAEGFEGVVMPYRVIPE